MDQYIKRVDYTKIGQKTTVCCITLWNGFEIVGVSSCLHPEQYSRHVGERLAREDAMSKVKQLKAFAEQQRRHLSLSELPF